MGLLIKNAVLDGKKRDILISGGKINRIEMEIKVSDKNIQTLDAEGNYAVPSFKNGHTHSAMVLLRGFADDMKLKPWLEEKIWPAEAKLTPEAIYWGTRAACLEMIKSGTTFCNEMYFNFEMTQKAIIDSGMKSANGPALFDFFDPDKKQELKDLCIKSVESGIHTENNSLILAVHSVYTVSKESLMWIADYASSRNIPVHIHLSETETEVEACIKRYGIRPVELLKETGILDTKLIAAHSVWLDEKEMDLLAEHDVTVIHNPVSNMKIAVGNVFPYMELKKRDVKIMLGTDGCSSNNNLDMFEEMKTAALLHKFHSGNPEVMKADEILKIAGGSGTEMFSQLGSGIRQGEQGDLILLDKDNLNLAPNHNLASNIVYSANGSCVDSVISGGKLLMHKRKTAGEKEILENVKRLSEELFS